jgi:hypothetical protein
MANNTVNSSTIGVNLQGNSDGATANFALGTHVLGNAGSEWIYVYATSALSTGQIVAINTGFVVMPANASNLLNSAQGSPNSGDAIGFAQGTFAAADFGWVVLRGQNQYVALSNVSTLGAALYVSINSGFITTAAASGTLAGIILMTASASGVLNPSLAYLSYPRLNGGAAIGV